MARRSKQREAIPLLSCAVARSVGEGKWAVDFLPGRTLSSDQARAALRVAEELNNLRSHATSLGLTLLELVGLATMHCSEQRPCAHAEAAQVLAQIGRDR
ncbi:hypothetical protein OG225_36860 [Nocardia sp. NBC_01377]|uniref:hypothetical protein n=1 Tax=Nocardia sp. NBC_01377 TaxID=2903595 RepID=UPI00324F76F8